MHRRNVLRALAGLPLISMAGGLYAAPATSTRLLLVFLRGGYDGASLLIPVSSNFYYEARPNIAIARPGGDVNAALSLNADWGLHPALRDTIYPLYTNGQAAFIPFAGTDDTSRSHFETQDSIELGQSINHSRNYRSGFLNRLAGVLNGNTAISFTDQLPLALQGTTPIPNIALRSIGAANVDARQSGIISSMYKNTALAKRVDEGFTVRDDVMREMASEMEAANRNAITAKGFEAEARRVAKLMKDKYNIGFIDIGGWDTHVGQGGASGYLAGRLSELGRGLASYREELGSAWRDTVVVVISEFGRTFRENGNRGTDHGHGSVYWVLGGSIHGGRVAGKQERVDQASLFQNRDYPVLNEYRAVLGGLFSRLYSLNAAQIGQVFPDARPTDIGLI